MSQIKLFEDRKVRTVWNEADGQWYFVVVDVIQILTDSPNPSDYIKKIRKRDEQLSKGWGQIVTPLIKEATKFARCIKNKWGTICTLVDIEVNFFIKKIA